MAKLIAITGNMGAGKDAWGAALKKHLEDAGKTVEHTAFANPLKEFAKKYFGWEGIKNDDRRNNADDSRLIGGRTLLQGIGLMLREEVSRDFWVKQTMNFLVEHQDSDFIIITDCRFINEAMMVSFDMGELVYVRRQGLEVTSDHPSETEQHSVKFQNCVTKTVLNDASLEALQEHAGYYANMNLLKT